MNLTNLKRIKQKYEYDGFVALIQNGLNRIGINISFLYLVEEGLHLQVIPFNAKEFEGYKIEFLDEDHMDFICSISERPLSKEKLLERMTNGSRCLIIKKDEKIVGYTWFNLLECSFDSRGFHFPLKENEAYLFDIYIIMEYRGKNLAPFIRYRSYEELKKIDRTVLYSTTNLLNKRSIRFKKKLNAKFLYQIFYLSLFKKLRYSKKIKEFVKDTKNKKG